MPLSDRAAAPASLAALFAVLLGAGPVVAQTPSLPNERPDSVRPSTGEFDYQRREVMIPMRDGVKLHTVILVPKGAEARAHPADPHALRRRRAHDATPTSAHLGPSPVRLRQRDRRDRRGRLHPRRAGRPRQVRLRGRLRHEPAAARAAEPDAGRPRHRHLRHHRLAGEEHPREQRQGRHPRHLLRRLPAADGAGQSAPGAQGGGADEPDGGRLDGRRLVPQRRLPPAQHVLHLRPGGHARQRRRSGGRSHYDDYDMFMQAGSAGELGRRRGLEQIGFWQKLLEHPAYDAFWQRPGDGQAAGARSR